MDHQMITSYQWILNCSLSFNTKEIIICKPINSKVTDLNKLIVELATNCTQINKFIERKEEREYKEAGFLNDYKERNVGAIMLKFKELFLKKFFYFLM
ncbi:unnamed protein product [Wuchereria bancrofti]|uniref:Uncharacterized protein n=1 Tax=Wuchereria bancrofti TaxID=6293 RepID=A0A3P7EQZ1_WUCBA|nr:unnamed protein product [Wuchereria bancrofti]